MNILLINDVFGRLDRLAAVLDHERTTPIKAIFALGNLVAPTLSSANAPISNHVARRQSGTSIEQQQYTAVLELLGSLGVPVYLLPGDDDLPLATINQALQAYRGSAMLHLVHRTSAPLGELDVVSGFGGQLTNGGESVAAAVQFPAWEARVAFEHLAAYDTAFQNAARRIFLFATPPQGERIDRFNGSHVGAPLLNSVIRAYQPHIVCCGGPSDSCGIELIYGTRVVNPGALADGSYALIDFERLNIQLKHLPERIPAQAAQFHSIIVAIDGSAESWRALELATGLAQASQAQLTLVTVFDRVPAALGKPYLEDSIAARIAHSEQLLAEATQYVCGVEPQCEVLEGPAAAAILRAAETHRADLIVMGARGLGAVRALLGSVSHRVLQHATCPVLIAREQPRSSGLAARALAQQLHS